MNIEQDIKRTKKRAKLGCLSWAIILIFGPILLVAGTISYELYFKERTLEISNSPNNINTIKIVEKGEAFSFGLSTIRIKYGWKHLDRNIGNDGATLNSTNVSVMWKNDNEAIVTLNGKEQESEDVQINFK